jgi:dsRNA-specific ribonuclease
MSFEKPPAPEKKDEFAAESSLERAGIEGLFAAHIESREDLSSAQKDFILKHMREHKHENWSRYNGKDVKVESIMLTQSGDLDLYMSIVDDRSGEVMDISPPVIRFPEELKKR